MNSQSRVFLGSYGLLGWEDGKVENEKGWKSRRIKKILIFFICVWLKGWKNEGVEKWEHIKDFNFPHLCLVEMVEKWRNGNFF